jgi:hypothetical protein
VTRTLTIGYHGHCFDGMCSAAVLSRMLSAIETGPLAITCRGLEHAPGGSFVPEDILSGEINAVVDFRYTTSPRLGWWFDHHLSGIAGTEEQAHFAADRSGRKFFDPAYGSCCKLVADIARARFDLAWPELADLVHWADIIDAARFPDAQSAIDLSVPALRLMTVIEDHGDDAFLAPRIALLARGVSLPELAGDREVQELFAPLGQRHERTLDLITRTARCERGVVTFDLVGSGTDRYNKFIAYYVHPDARYTVAVSAGRARAKISVGSNPWATTPLPHDIAEICGRYGGGGHRAVGAISLAPNEIARAREIAVEIANELAL